MTTTNLIIYAWLTIGALYGIRLSRRYAQTKYDFVLIPAASSVLWPFLLVIERG
jgi:hypothetical protein